jgi:hypothetical protein
MTDTSAERSPFRFPDCIAEWGERECLSRGLHFCSSFPTLFFTLLRVCFPSPYLSRVLLSASLLETFALDYLNLSIPSSSFLRIICCTVVVVVVLDANILYPFVFPSVFFWSRFSYSLGLQLVATSPCTKSKLFLECSGFILGFEEFCVGFGRNPSQWGLLRSEECGGGGWRRLLACLFCLCVWLKKTRGQRRRRRRTTGELFCLRWNTGLNRRKEKEREEQVGKERK